ncbi:DddA-like double-stranded DNA deaminase toxin, partial [Frankia sp. Cr1]|uniref:DddA-like double-stranded DNA deaminase toxin n=1 Tax=Frankia sp. Cr1 TaxID=3073931 RepID=UPI002AD3EC27
TSTGDAGSRLATAFDEGARCAADAAAALRTAADGWEQALATYRRARSLADEALVEEQQHRASQASAAAHDLASGSLLKIIGDGAAALGWDDWQSPLRQQSRAVARGAIAEAGQVSATCVQVLDRVADALGALPPAPQPHKSWWDHGPLGWAVHETAQAADTVGNLAGSVLQNPGEIGTLGGDMAGMALGAGLMLLGAGEEVGGFALDVTGVGAVIGVPANILGAATIATGAVTAGTFAAKTGSDLSQTMTEARASGGSGSGDAGLGARPTAPVDPPSEAAPFRHDLADEVPAYGENGSKTSGLLDLGSGAPEPLTSGYNGPSKLLPKPRPGMNGNNVSHVEAHAAAQMRLQNVTEGTLYINRVPCGGVTGCDTLLPRMVPKGSRLTIYGPNGFVRVVEGQG